MTRDDIIAMARDFHVNCEYTEFGWQEIDRYEFSLKELEHFAALVAAAEREACAQLCADDGMLWGARYAAKIRARGDTNGRG